MYTKPLRVCYILLNFITFDVTAVGNCMLMIGPVMVVKMHFSGQTCVLVMAFIQIGHGVGGALYPVVMEYCL